MKDADLLDAGDESLQRYKQSLGLGGGKDLSDPSDPRVCIIQSLTMDSPGRDPVTIDLSTPGSEASLKDKPFKIKEGARFTMSAQFRVQHEILSGLHYVQAVKRKGIRVSKDSEMIVRVCGGRMRAMLTDYREATRPAPTSSLPIPRSVCLFSANRRDPRSQISPRGRGPLGHARPRPLQCRLQLRRRRQENPSAV